jgi:hypothetical protein
MPSRDDWVFGKHSPDQSRYFIMRQQTPAAVPTTVLPLDWPWSKAVRAKYGKNPDSRAEGVTLADPKSPEEIEALKKNKANVERNKAMKEERRRAQIEALITMVADGNRPQDVIDEAFFQRAGQAIKRGVSAVRSGYKKAKRTFGKVRRKVKRHQLRRAIKAGQKVQKRQQKQAYKQKQQQRRSQVQQRMQRLRKGVSARSR